MADDARLLRIITIATFLPAFPLCIAHGTLSHNPVPAVGLVPLAFSASVSIFLLSRHRSKGKKVDDDGEEGAGASHLGEEHHELAEPERRSPEAALAHPILVFFVDAILAAALMVVLVFTWIRTPVTNSPDLAMLAAYTTMPLFVNFLVHLYLAVREFAAGLALHGLLQWAAWHTVPPDCPHCGSRLRPDTLPTLPWVESMSAPKVSFPRFSMPSIPRPSLPNIKMKAPEWKTPAWLKGRRQGSQYASLFVNNEEYEDEDNRERYRDEPDEPIVHPEPSAATAGPVEEQEPVVEEVVVARNHKKSRSTPAPFGEEEAAWP
ncbi:hypothetical protein B0H66DRAFT_600313 [Apodospora peruviana]|uniref:Uncharacterized protein n=1 Tax=Apodospora peruviana TaxID=516989 RepID=A0AAE0MCP0_9PEZI|nr:hypothetical protein B0H66DRAFT_600313 [Apodospora peruviana]